ncbi:MAG: RNA polymerase sigma factor, partial [Actinomycetes bacterium]
MSDTARPLPPEFANPEVGELLARGRSTGQVTSGDVRTMLADAGIPMSRMKAILRSLSEEGVTIMVEADSTDARPGRKTVSAAAAARRATATQKVAEPSPKTTKKAVKKVEPVKKAGAKKAAPAGKPAAETADKPAAKSSATKKAASKPEANKSATAAMAGAPAEEVTKDVAAGDLPEEEPTALVEEEGSFTLSDEDEDDAPAQQVATAGATADPVKDYLKQIGK